MPSGSLRVGIVGCGLIGRKRAEALCSDTLVACFDVVAESAAGLASQFGAKVCASLDELLDEQLDAVIVATTHSELAKTACAALAAGAHVLVEKPGGIGVGEIDESRAERRREPSPGQGRVQSSLPSGNCRRAIMKHAMAFTVTSSICVVAMVTVAASVTNGSGVPIRSSQVVVRSSIKACTCSTCVIGCWESFPYTAPC